MVNRVSNDQLDELLEFLAEHPALARGVGLGSRSKEIVDRQWNDLARKLNSFGSGSSKSGDRWKKYIQPEVQDTATVQPDNIVVLEEVVISDTSEFPEPLTGLEEMQTQQVPEPNLTRSSQPRPARSRRRLRHNRPSLNSNSTCLYIDPRDSS